MNFLGKISNRVDMFNFFFEKKTESSKLLPKNLSKTFTTSCNDLDKNIPIQSKTLPPCTVFLMQSRTCLFFGVYGVLLSSFEYLPKQDHPREDSVEVFSYDTPIIFRISLPCLATTYASPKTTSKK